jgi:hypothetical protein
VPNSAIEAHRLPVASTARTGQIVIACGWVHAGATTAASFSSTFAMRRPVQIVCILTAPDLRVRRVGASNSSSLCAACAAS